MDRAMVKILENPNSSNNDTSYKASKEIMKRKKPVY